MRKWVSLVVIATIGVVAALVFALPRSSSKNAYTVVHVASAAKPVASAGAGNSSSQQISSRSGPLSPAEATHAPGATGPVVEPGTAQPISTATEAVAALLATDDVQTVTSSTAVATTWSNFLTIPGSPTVPSTLGVSASDPIWVAAATGIVTPEFANLQDSSFSGWEVVAYDAATGDPLGVIAGHGPLPSWFSELGSAAGA
jgi:hypothetical protein